MRVLVVDDQRSARHVLRKMLSDVPDVAVQEATSVAQASEACVPSAPDLIFLDIRLADDPLDRSGFDFLRSLRKSGVDVPVVMLTTVTDLGEVREALRCGAQDYISKDMLAPELLGPIVETYRSARVSTPLALSRSREPRNPGLVTMVGSSAATARMRGTIVRAAGSDATVLIRGETGTGKELVARALHDLSARKSEPFVAINCSALPGNLTESLLFGHEKGAFTGADRRSRGHFELAGAGTILLDEIAEMPADLQAKLLRVLEDRRFRPLGAEGELPLRARVLAATHVDLEQRIEEGKFRRDLYYRLDVLTIHVPPLHERAEDIPELLQAFVAESGRQLRFTDEALTWMQRRRWPGNVRELKNLVARLTVLAGSDQIGQAELVEFTGSRTSDWPAEIQRMARALLALPDDLGSKLHVLEKAVVEQALRACGGNKSAAARMMGIERKALERRCERHGADVGQTANDLN